MRKYILAAWILSGVAAAQGFRVPLLQRDPADAERAALHEKLTRLADTRKELGLAEAQPARELDQLTAAAKPKRVVAKGAPQRATRTVAAAHAWPPPDATWTSGNPEPSLGDVARKYRAQKRHARSSSSKE